MSKKESNDLPSFLNKPPPPPGPPMLIAKPGSPNTVDGEYEITHVLKTYSIDDFADAMAKCAFTLAEASSAIRRLAEITANLPDTEPDQITPEVEV